MGILSKPSAQYIRIQRYAGDVTAAEKHYFDTRNGQSFSYPEKYLPFFCLWGRNPDTSLEIRPDLDTSDTATRSLSRRDADLRDVPDRRDASTRGMPDGNVDLPGVFPLPSHYIPVEPEERHADQMIGLPSVWKTIGKNSGRGALRPLPKFLQFFFFLITREFLSLNLYPR